MRNLHCHIRLLSLSVLLHCPLAFAQSGPEALFKAAESGNVAEVRKALSQGVSANIADPAGWTPLMVAAGEGQLAVAQALVKGGANVNAASKKGETALMAAVLSGNAAVVKYLLAEGADKSAATAKGLTAADIAQQAKKPEIAKLLASAKSASGAGAASTKQGSAKEAAAVEAYQKNRFDDAARLFKELTELNPRSAEAWHFLGQSAAKTGDVDGARKAYERFLEIEPRGELAEHTRRILAQFANDSRAAEGRRKAQEEAIRGLQWADADNGANINWIEADRYCTNKGSGWRLPTMDELQASYELGHTTPCGDYTCKVSSNSRLTAPTFWSGEPYRPRQSWYFQLDNGYRLATGVEVQFYLRALCVRRP